MYSFSITTEEMITHLVASNNSHLLSQSCTSEIQVAQLGPRLRVSQERNQDVSQAGLLSGGSGEESASEVIQVICRF